MLRFLRSKAPRCGTCCHGFCSPQQSFLETPGRCALPPERTADRPAPQEQPRYSHAFRPLYGSCGSEYCPRCSSSVGRHPEPEWPDKPFLDHSHLEGRSCNERLYRPPSSSSRSLPPGAAGSRTSSWRPPWPPASTSSSFAYGESPSLSKLAGLRANGRALPISVDARLKKGAMPARPHRREGPPPSLPPSRAARGLMALQ